MHSLLFFQFALLYIPAFMIGLAVFGSDFKFGTGWVYVGTLALFTVLHLFRRFWNPYLGLAVFRLTAGLGATAGVWCYHAIHVDYWDEHSWPQALLVCLLGVGSYIGQAWAAQRIDLPDKALSPVLLLAVLTWVMASVYPMVAILLVSIILLNAAILVGPRQETASTEVKAKAGYRYRYALFLILLDIFLVVWDYKVNSDWGWYLAASFASCLAASRLSIDNGRALTLIYTVAVTNFVAAALFPVYVIQWPHSVIAGFALGVLLRQVALRARQSGMGDLINLWPVMLFALAVGYSVYANLSEAQLRVVLLLPLLLGLILAPHLRYVRKRRKVT